MKYLIYLITNKDETRFKVGYSTTETFKTRLKSYISHNPDVVFLGYVNVGKKEVEKYIHTELKKLWYIPCNILGQKEWFNGSLTLDELKQMVNKLSQDRIITGLI